MRWPTSMATRVGMAMTMVDLPDRPGGCLVRLLGHSSSLERLELCHEKYKGVMIGGISGCKSATCGKGGSKLFIDITGIPIAVGIFCSLSEEIVNWYNVFVIPRVVNIIRVAVLDLSETDLPRKLILANYYIQKVSITYRFHQPRRFFTHGLSPSLNRL